MPASLSEPPPELTLEAGETARFHLRGAGAAGYDWRWTIAGDVSAITVAVEPATPALGPGPPLGQMQTGSVDLLLVVRGVHPGLARVDLLLARPPTSKMPPLADFSMAVTVGAR